MYRIAVCEDDPRTAEQNKTAACHVLEGKGRSQGRDYDVEVFHTAAPLMKRLTADPDAYQLLLVSSLYKPTEDYDALGRLVCEKAKALSRLLGFLGK